MKEEAKVKHAEARRKECEERVKRGSEEKEKKEVEKEENDGLDSKEEVERGFQAGDNHSRGWAPGGRIGGSAAGPG